MPLTDTTADASPSGKPASGREPVKGIFSTQSVLKVGTGTTTRKTIQKAYWYVKERGEDALDIQPLNKNHVPSGPKRTITMEDLLTKFAPEPEFYISVVYPKMQELSNTIQKGERHREKGEIFSAELEFTQALRVDEDNVKATFGLGLTYLDRGESTKANDIFERLVHLDAAFDTEHKHLFNDFGINLRKNKMYAQALDYYRRAETLCESDEHLYYNIARAYLEQENPAAALDYLKKALTLNPALIEARKFVRYLVEKGFVNGDKPDVAALLPLDKA